MMLTRPAAMFTRALHRRACCPCAAAAVGLEGIGRPRFLSTSLQEEEKQVVGFVGLGNMGLPMAINLASHHDGNVTAFDVNTKSMTKAEMAGIQPASSLQQVAASSNIIFTMLPGCSAVNAVMEEILLKEEDSTTSSNKKIFVDCSTVSPTTSRRWHAELEEKGHVMLDAPVSGGVKGATDATLTFMVGCSDERALSTTVTPLLEKMGSRVIYCGGAGAGASVKLCNNLALATQMIGISEAMNLGDALGVDPVVLANVLNMSTAKCWSSEVNNPHPTVAAQKESPASKNYEGGFGTRLMLKDLGLAVQSGQEEGVALPLGTASKELYQLVEKRGMGDKDFGVMLQFLRGK